MKFILLLLTSMILSHTLTAQEPMLSQPKIVVLPKSLGGIDALTLMKKDSLIQTTVAAIKRVLVERKLELADLEQLIGNTDFNRSIMAGLNADANAMLASSADADVYVEFDVQIVQEGRGRKAKINFNVKEAATAKVLGAGTGNSDSNPTNDIGGLCASAVNNEIDRIMEQIRSYWDDLPKYGKPMIVTIAFQNTQVNGELPSGQYIDEVVEEWIKNNSKTYRMSTTDKTMIFSPVYVDYIKYDSPSKFGREIRKLFDKTLGMKIKVQNTGKSIRIEEQN
ncbi:MAG: DUF6175 family protein [Chitinophagaceae bacterium]